MRCFTVGIEVEKGIRVLLKENDNYVIVVGQKELKISNEVSLTTMSEINPHLTEETLAVWEGAIAIPKDEYSSSYDICIMKKIGRDFDHALVYFTIPGIYNYNVDNTKIIETVEGTPGFSKVLLLMIKDCKISINVEDMTYTFFWLGGTTLQSVSCSRPYDDPVTVIENNMNKFNIYG